MTEIRHSESFWTTLVEKDWKKCKMVKIEHSESFQTSWWEKMGKSAEQPKLGVLNHFGPLW